MLVPDGILSGAVESPVVLVAGRGEVEGRDDPVGGEPGFVDLLAVLAVVEEPAEGDGCWVGVHLEREHCCNHYPYFGFPMYLALVVFVYR